MFLVLTCLRCITVFLLRIARHCSSVKILFIMLSSLTNLVFPFVFCCFRKTCYVLWKHRTCTGSCQTSSSGFHFWNPFPKWKKNKKRTSLSDHAYYFICPVNSSIRCWISQFPDGLLKWTSPGNAQCKCRFLGVAIWHPYSRWSYWFWKWT